MEFDEERETATERLLYDDAAPRLRRPINATILKFRAPGLLFVPVTLLVAAALPGALTALVLGEALSTSLQVVAAGAGAFYFVLLLIALMFSRREEQSFAQLTPNLLSVTHAFLALALGLGFLALGPMQRPEIAELLAAMPGPVLDTPVLQLLKAYCILFAVMTAASIGAGLLFHLIGFRRVVAGDA